MRESKKIKELDPDILIVDINMPIKITMISICVCGFMSLIVSLLKVIYLEMNFN
ncbi:hypothetical protein [Clostridium estertheticum]|uniref:hypothetical protein n=1 Tax=Clostridium estertheticum TaxID=238834 RepID=UPI001C0D86C0|nr:hypothetical protein [Clostridium estertheticum]MBU3172508.1 hypothetical protein [Clostridium estertheticum]